MSNLKLSQPGVNLKINLDEEKDKPDVKFNKEQKQNIKPNTGFSKEHKQDIKPNTGFNKERKQDTKPEIELNKDVKPNIEFKQDVKKPGTNKITYEEEKVALVLTSIFTVWWMLK